MTHQAALAVLATILGEHSSNLVALCAWIAPPDVCINLADALITGEVGCPRRAIGAAFGFERVRAVQRVLRRFAVALEELPAGLIFAGRIGLTGTDLLVDLADTLFASQILVPRRLAARRALRLQAPESG